MTPNDSCHYPHWGYIIKGAFRFVYDDGSEDPFPEGDLYYAPAGHTAVAEGEMWVRARRMRRESF